MMSSFNILLLSFLLFYVTFVTGLVFFVIIVFLLLFLLFINDIDSLWFAFLCYVFIYRLSWIPWSLSKLQWGSKLQCFPAEHYITAI